MERVVFPEIKNFRYERKFYIEGAEREMIESLVRFHPAVFRQIYCERTVNNIYLDSPGLSNYFDNINGQTRRVKVRVRWYGELFGHIENPALEIKLKHNVHVGKITHRLMPFKLDSAFSIDVMRKVIRASDIGEIVKSYLYGLESILLNSYRRKYFLSADQRYRVTVDSDVRVYGLSHYSNNFLSRLPAPNDVVLEIKYNKPNDELIDEITNYFPFRIARNSKYVSGVWALSP